jgi:hypothetical protein
MREKNHIINIGNNSFEMVEHKTKKKTPFEKKLRANRTQEKLAIIRCRISYLPVLSKNIKIRISRTIILYGCETWPLTVRRNVG